MEGTAGDLCAWCLDLLELNRHGLRSERLEIAGNVCVACSTRQTTTCFGFQMRLPTPQSCLRPRLA
jgi:hypothetical protein